MIIIHNNNNSLISVSIQKYDSGKKNFIDVRFFSRRSEIKKKKAHFSQATKKFFITGKFQIK